MSDKKILTKNELRDRLRKEIDLTKTKTSGRSLGGQPPVLAKPKNIRQTIGRLLGYMGVYRYALFLITIFLMVSTVFLLLIPTMFQRAIDNHIEIGDYTGVYRIVVIILVLAAIYSVIRFFSRFFMVRISQGVVKKIRGDAFDRLLRAPVSYFDEKGSGDIVSRLSNDMELISNSLGNTFLEVVSSAIIFTGSLVFMFYLNWILALVVVVFIPLMAFLIIWVSKKTRKGFKAQQTHLATLNGIIEENITGLKTVKLYNQEGPVTEEFSQENDALKKAGFMAQFYAGLILPVIHFMNNIIFLSVIAVGGLLYIGPGLVSIGQVAGIAQYSRMIIMPIGNLAQLFNALMQGIAGAERVFELIDAEDEYENDGAYQPTDFSGAITFDSVSFSYEKGTPVLKDITFDALKGQKIAIVGPTGGGKTTTIKLLNRFYDLDDGVIRIDGTDISDYKKDALRKKIGVVLQDTHLFKGSVFKNIHYGDFSATEEEVITAAKMAGAHDFISRLPKGYATEILEGGQNFSQGERQLISIARTFLNNPDLLILDEATSNIDTRTESKIQTSMRKLMENRTSIVIAHRLQTIREADKILVIDKGSLIESGTHETLLAQKGFYYNLYRTQFGQ